MSQRLLFTVGVVAMPSAYDRGCGSGTRHFRAAYHG